ADDVVADLAVVDLSADEREADVAAGVRGIFSDVGAAERRADGRARGNDDADLRNVRRRRRRRIGVVPTDAEVRAGLIEHERSREPAERRERVGRGVAVGLLVDGVTDASEIIRELYLAADGVVRGNDEAIGLVDRRVGERRAEDDG